MSASHTFRLSGLSSCTHQALWVPTLRRPAGPPGAQSPAEQSQASEQGRGRGPSSSGKVLRRFLGKAVSELGPDNGKEKACTPLPISMEPHSLFPPSLPRTWALLPASFCLISFNTPIRLLQSHFLASHCCHLQTKGAAPCLCLRPLRRQDPLWAFLRHCPQAQQESQAPSGGACVSQPVPWSCPGSLKPPLLSGCPTRPRQHPEITPPPTFSFASAQLGPEFTAFGHL